MADIEHQARTFPDDPASVREAREFVKRALGGLARRDDAVLLVSELATNAVIHAAGRFEVAIAPRDDLVWIGVSDASEDQPVILDPGPLANSGRGLRIVERLATQWGVARTSSGKVVWFTLPLGAAAPSS